MTRVLCLAASLFALSTPAAFSQMYEARIVNEDKGNERGVWIVKYHKDEFANTMGNRNTDICLKLRVVQTGNKIMGTLWRYDSLNATETLYQLRGGGGGRIPGFEFTIDRQGTDRRREKFSTQEVTYTDIGGNARTIKLVGYWHAGREKKQGNDKKRSDDTIQMRVIDKPANAGNGNKQQNGCVELLQAAEPCPEDPDTDVLEEQPVNDPEASPPYDGP